MSAPRLSVVTPVRNRLPSLLSSLPSWQRCAQVGEIVVVDLGSAEPIRAQHFSSVDKLKIVRVANADCWRIGLAINIGVDCAAHDGICKLDADIELHGTALSSTLDLASAFYRGRAGTPVSNGQVIFHRSHWRSVGGYNEWLSGYGYDDSDFYTRLRRQGLAERDIEAGWLTEHRHGNEIRAATDLRTEFFTIQCPTADDRLVYMLSRNTYLAMLRRWTPELRTTYRGEELADGTMRVTLDAMADDYRWADGMASMLAVVRVSGIPRQVELLNSLVSRYLAECGGL